MVETGLLGPEDRVELIHGEILTMSPQKSAHATGVQLVGDALRAVFGTGFVVRTQLPLALGGESEPEPDVAVVTGSARDFRDAHPTTAHLVVEVAEASLDFDRGAKKSVYAAAGIGEYWIVDLPNRMLEVYREAHHGDFLDRQRLGSEDSVSPLARPQSSLKVADLLP